MAMVMKRRKGQVLRLETSDGPILIEVKEPETARICIIAPQCVQIVRTEEDRGQPVPSAARPAR